ncbi:MAG: hydrogenase expression/formation protein HypE [Myxococcota bacterium]|nr:hydrogenase expression/formation protein HypE [Myxococcota bacterium]
MAMELPLLCPLPAVEPTQILLTHGGGGRLMHRLIERVFAPAFASPHGETHHDGALLPPGGAARLAFTTDAYVVRPLFFPGGDIGRLAVCGTVNDLAMCGARPLYLSAAFILEEGLPLQTLEQVVGSMRQAAHEAGVEIVTGDTKVVERGRGDGLYITTAGIGLVEHGLHVAPASIRAGDAVLVSGDLGRHGVAVLAVREGLDLECPIQSDCAPLAEPVRRLLAAGLQVHCLRDLTRGGLAAALVELAEASGLSIAIDGAAVPLREEVRGACEILGLDPLQLACEGRFLCVLPEEETVRALALLGPEAAHIGRVHASTPPQVTLRGPLGAWRIVEMPSGEQLPRIC